MEPTLLLERVGLSEKAAKAYLASLQLGAATMTQLAKASGLKRPTTYLAVDELLTHGFLAVAKKGKRAIYTPEHPQRLLQVLHSREREMARALPELEALYYEPKDRPRISVLEGREALQRVYRDIFDAVSRLQQEALFFTAIGDLQDNYPDLVEEFFHTISHAERAYRMRELNLGDARGIDYARKIRKFGGPKHFIRLLDPEQYRFANTDNLVLGNRVMIFSMRRDILVIVIEHAEIAQMYRAMFEAAWHQGREVPA